MKSPAFPISLGDGIPMMKMEWLYHVAIITTIILAECPALGQYSLAAVLMIEV
jgi:hypothetical protein